MANLSRREVDARRQRALGASSQTARAWPVLSARMSQRLQLLMADRRPDCTIGRPVTPKTSQPKLPNDVAAMFNRGQQDFLTDAWLL